MNFQTVFLVIAKTPRKVTQIQQNVYIPVFEKVKFLFLLHLKNITIIDILHFYGKLIPLYAVYGIIFK
jgi:hypothetical protein